MKVPKVVTSDMIRWWATEKLFIGQCQLCSWQVDYTVNADGLALGVSVGDLVYDRWRLVML